MNHKTAICLLTRKLNIPWVHFLKTCINYDIYIVIDDNEPLYYPMLENIHIIQISDEECLRNNYYNSSTVSNLKNIIAWDKALYYFNRKNTIPYENIWFIEDDVFFMSEQTLTCIDEKYPTSDLLCAFHETNERGDIHAGWNHWVNVIHLIGTPWAHSLICVCRLSKRLLERVDAYVADRPLLFIEALFNTLALQNHFIIDNPDELKETITYNKKWDHNELDPNKIYHPIKNIDDHTLIRNTYRNE